MTIHRSQGLCAIDFDRDEDVATFLELNSMLHGTTRSRGSRGGMGVGEGGTDYSKHPSLAHAQRFSERSPLDLVPRTSPTVSILPSASPETGISTCLKHLFSDSL
jgi:hypothetical protein